MTYGTLIDMYMNEVEVSPSSNVRGGIWLRVRRGEEYKPAHLSVLDTKVLIAILEKAIEHQEEE